ncbi:MULTISPECIES: hypothetical protein [Clostridium]|uniref:Uncharacterized protein n=1 Tax=Clostridium manihotivorum TaxID=2320868 RepID=A0A3R5UFU1_9CLOT|nr:MULTISPECIES: hypothetical protein [Clostridium]QAA32709.1 hypothetical protein C1I91_14290 [Clostridium manihotivorum]UZQ48829.1 hypothetical protein OP486_12640 [Clostridium kluyveri]
MNRLVLNTSINMQQGANKFRNKLNNFITKKKKGDDKLIVALVLAALGVGLCIYFRNNIYDIMTSTVATLKTQIQNLIAGTVKA